MAWTSAQGATAAMTVVDGVTGLPIAGATVVSAGAERVTANDGTFMMPMDGPDGGIAMTVRAPGYARLETVANGTTPRAIALAPLLAEEAARMGFDEVQFDYLRFPDAPGLRFSETNTSARRVAAITGFLSAARDRLRHYNIYLSADIFGYVCWNLDDTAIGQQLETLGGLIDYISPMLYPSGFTEWMEAIRRNKPSQPSRIALSETSCETAADASHRSGDARRGSRHG